MLKMTRTKTLLIALTAVAVYFQTALSRAQPVAPTAELRSQIKAAPKQIPDLPYKPFAIDDDPSAIQNSASEEAVPDLADTGAPQEAEIDWSKLPFIPSKLPDFAPAPDPQIF